MAGKELKVAYQGVPGAYSEKATRQLLSPFVDGKSEYAKTTASRVRAIGFESFDDAFEAVQSERAAFGVLPIENSLGGSIHANYDLLLKFGLCIVGEYDLRVEHCLLALPGVAKADIKHVISHPQALAQCARSVSHLGARPRAEYDTAGSAKLIADHQWSDTAALASDLAAEYYGLQVLERNMEDDSENFTRFLLLAKAPTPSPLDRTVHEVEQLEFKTSLVFSFMESNEKGQLYKGLSAFSLRDIDLCKIESRPWSFSAAQHCLDEASKSLFDTDVLHDRRKYKYLFYVDIIGHQNDEIVVNALRHLREFCRFVRVLGSYPTKGRLTQQVQTQIQSIGVAQTLSNGPAVINAQTVTKGTSPPQEFRTTSTSVAARLNVGIYGFGNFGQFLAKTFAKYHAVRATSRTDYSALATGLGCSFYNSNTQLREFFDQLDILVVCVSILSFENVLQQIPPQLLEKIVIVDVLSVKSHAKQVLLAHAPASSGLLCTHPMFGPESGKHSWRGLPLMYEKVRVVDPATDQKMNSLLRVFELEMCRMLEMTCEQHDEFAASSQFLTHLTGRILHVQGVKNTPIDTRGFQHLVRLVHDTCKDSFDLFQGLYEFNPNSEQQILKLEQSLQEVALQLRTMSKKNTLRKLQAKAPTSDPKNTLAEQAAALVVPNHQLFPLNPLINKVTTAKTVVIHGITKQLEAEGKQVYSLCVGEPDFLPDLPIREEAKKAIDQGKFKYTDVKGTMALRQQIAKYLKAFKNVTYDPATEILVSNGAKQAVYQALVAICNPGEKVLIPSPYWVSYPDMVKLAGAEPLFLRTSIEDSYLMSPDQLESILRVNPTTKAMILCNPSNPAGVLYSLEQLQALAKVLSKPEFADIIVISDEIYEQLVFQDDGVAKRSHASFASLPQMYARTLTINGFSKSYGMPGMRIGYLAAPKYFVAPATTLQSQFTSCANSIGQIAACRGVELEFEATKEVPRISNALPQLDAKRKYVVDRLRAIPRLRFAYPTAAFYVFMDLRAYFGNGNIVTTPAKQQLANTDEFCEYLLRSFQTALVPGSAFGEPFGCRLSYASSMEELTNALNGLEQALQSLQVVG